MISISSDVKRYKEIVVESKNDLAEAYNLIQCIQTLTIRLKNMTCHLPTYFPSVTPAVETQTSNKSKNNSKKTNNVVSNIFYYFYWLSKFMFLL